MVELTPDEAWREMVALTEELGLYGQDPGEILEEDAAGCE